MRISISRGLSAAKTYIVALVAIVRDSGLATAQVDAGVDVCLAPGGTLGRVHRAGRDAAARNRRLEGLVGQQLGRRASDGRSGDNQSRVEHG